MAEDWVSIGSGALTARINPLGAELSSLTDAAGAEWMTDADPAYWAGRAPILFPVVGKPSGEVIRVDGRAYPMKQHGFARRLPFEVAEASGSRAVFLLRDSPETREHYPFAFELRIGFVVEDATLTVTAEIANPDPAWPLSASLGFHPAFAWPLPGVRDKTSMQVIFADIEPDDLRAIAPDGTIAAGTVASPLEDGRVLFLRDDLFAHDALVWDRVRSREVVYGQDGGPVLRLAYDAPMLGIWTKPVRSGVDGPGPAFLCLEPWHGIADPEGYAGEFRDKPGVFEVAPGGTWRTTMTVTLEP